MTAPTRPAPSSVVRPPVERAGDRAGEERDEGDRAGGGDADRGQQHAEQEQQRRCGRGATPSPAAASSPSSVARSERATTAVSGQQHASSERRAAGWSASRRGSRCR